MDIVFLGGVFEKNKVNEIINKSKSGIQFAADALQWNIIEGLDYWNENPIMIINAPFIGSYPNHYKDIYLKRSRWSHVLNATDYNIGFLNIWGIKNIFRAFNIAKEADKWANTKRKDKVIIAYSINMAFLWTFRKVKKANADITTSLVVPDLPQHMNLTVRTNFLYKIAKKIDSLIINKLMKYVDTFVLLTESMAESLKVDGRPYCVIEGMVNKKDIIFADQKIAKEHSIKSILYTGTLNYKYGIELLLDAFTSIKDISYELWICGYGEAEEQIKNLAKVDQRVKWFGSVSREKALLLQQKATVLINPRPPGKEFTKYSFPSKNLEYLLSGRPVIGYKLPGIPDDYDRFMFFIDGDSANEMAKVIVNVGDAGLGNIDGYLPPIRCFNKLCK